MWRNYWTVAVRALAKSRTYSIINIAGLAIGMAACIMILLYINYERSYDSWLPDVENTYQLQAWYPHPTDGDPIFLQMTSYTTKGMVMKDFPQIERGVYALASEPVFMKDGQASTTKDYLLTDGDFTKVVNLPMVAGTGTPAAQTAMLSQSEAIKRFGTDQVVGKTMTTISKGVTRDFKITGVFKDIPKNSSLKVSAIERLDFNSFFAKEQQFLTCWGCQSGWVYLKLRPGTDVRQLEAQMPAWEKRNIPDQPNGSVNYNPGTDEDWHFVNLRDVHLGKAQGGTMTPGNDRRSIATFAIIAVLILAMAVVNFTNLATARAGQRAREVALRKVLGATRRQLIVQFVAESILISAVAMLLALALVELLVRYAVRKLGFKSPQDAIGKVVKSELFEPGTGMVDINIIGVVGDSRFRSVRTPIDPIMFQDQHKGPSFMIIRYRGDPKTVEAAVERQWKQVSNDVPFQAKFSEDVMRDLYKAEDARAQIFAGFSLLAVVIGCLGLFGLAAFSAERRTKEIGIRKVLGARTRDIVRLLVWQFSRPVIIANVIAWPVAWWFMRDWLNGFDQRIALTPIPFVIAGAVALGIAIATVVGHAVRVARANPIHALRYE